MARGVDLDIWMVRGRWPGGESLSRVEREAVIHSAHFGQDVGSNDLAKETRAITAYERSRLECSRERWPLVGLPAVQLCFSVFFLASSGRWVAAVAISLIAGSALGCSWRVVQSRPQRREQLWNAEWYAAQRLGRAPI